MEETWCEGREGHAKDTHVCEGKSETYVKERDRLRRVQTSLRYLRREAVIVLAPYYYQVYKVRMPSGIVFSSQVPLDR